MLIQINGTKNGIVINLLVFPSYICIVYRAEHTITYNIGNTCDVTVGRSNTTLMLQYENSLKYTIGRVKLQYLMVLGFHLGHGQMHDSIENIAVIMTCLRLKNKFVTDFSDVTSPLTYLTEK